MSHGFLSDLHLSAANWQAFERMIARLLAADGFQDVMHVGRSGDGGADVLATKWGRRWLFQVKRWTSPVGPKVIAETVNAAILYGADVPVVVSRNGYERAVYTAQSELARGGIKLQLWDRSTLLRKASSLSDEPPVALRAGWKLREYQEKAVADVVGQWRANSAGSALVVLATGLGKTVVAAETFRRIARLKDDARILVLAHRNELVYQLEKSFWPMLAKHQASLIWNGYERPPFDVMKSTAAIFACVDSLAAISDHDFFTDYQPDIVLVDECHHIETTTYDRVLEALGVGQPGGPFLLGLTATPWRPDGAELDKRFAGPTVSIDIISGLQQGFLANVDYRIYTDNVDWDQLQRLQGDRFTPRVINRTLFIDEWDDAVVDRIAEAFAEIINARGIVFCGTVEHAERIAARINALGFTRAEAIYSRSSRGVTMPPVERNRMIWDFSQGQIGILCAVDVLNEGIDVPDVNLVVFQRVTHSRRIFVQQLGRGLRLAPGKQNVVVLDFVSDVRRFAAGLTLKRAFDQHGPRPGQPLRVRLPNKVSFRRRNFDDDRSATFLEAWLGEVGELEESGEDTSILRFPPLDQFPTRRG